MRVTVSGVKLFFDVDGAKLVPEGPWLRERPTLVLIHSGPGFDHQVFKAHLGPATTAFAQAVYLDLRGHGRSDPAPAEQLRLDVWADDVRGFCDELGIERPVVLGHGFGGLVATRYVARHPEQPGGLVVTAPYARGRGQDRRGVRPARRAGGGGDRAPLLRRAEPCHARRVPSHLLSAVVRSAESAEELTRSVFSADTFIEWTRAEGSGAISASDLAGVTVPTLVLAGEDDPTRRSRRHASTPMRCRRARPVPQLRRHRHPVFREPPDALDELRPSSATSRTGRAQR